MGPDSAAFAQVGDGAIVHGQGQDFRVAFWPEPAEYANATDFITDDSFCDRIRFDTIEEAMTEVAAFTDGLQRVALDFSARAPHLGFFGPLFSAIRSAEDHESARRTAPRIPRFRSGENERHRRRQNACPRYPTTMNGPPPLVDNFGRSVPLDHQLASGGEVRYLLFQTVRTASRRSTTGSQLLRLSKN